MKILPLALVLIATPAFAQHVSTPKLRKSSPPPPSSITPVLKKVDVAASPSPSPSATPAKPSGASRSVKKAAAKPTKEKTASVEAAAEPKKKGGFFRFFGNLFGGGKKKKVDAPAIAGETPAAPSATTGRKPATRGAATGVPGSVTRPDLKKAKSETSNIRPAIPSGEVTDRPATVPPPAQTDGSRRATRPVLPPTPENAGSSTIKPSAKPAKAEGQGTSSIMPSAPAKPSSGSSSSLPGPRTAPETTPAGEFDKARYQKIRREAAADPSVASLGAKLNETAPGPNYKKAARAYSTALFDQMRKLDPSQKDWFDRMESATIRRIESGKTLVAE